MTFYLSIACGMLAYGIFIINKELNILREFNIIQLKINEKQGEINSEILTFKEEAQETIRTQDGVISELVRHTEGLQQK